MNALMDSAPLIAGGNWDHGGFWWFPFALLWLVLLGVAVWLVVRALRPPRGSGSERASEILAERYARGEVSGAEYRERLDELRRHSGGTRGPGGSGGVSA
jgi:putative membrane protein